MNDTITTLGRKGALVAESWLVALCNIDNLSRLFPVLFSISERHVLGVQNRSKDRGLYRGTINALSHMDMGGFYTYLFNGVSPNDGVKEDALPYSWQDIAENKIEAVLRNTSILEERMRSELNYEVADEILHENRQLRKIESRYELLRKLGNGVLVISTGAAVLAYFNR
eukprot:jgi/Bigna1/138973/aug1.47_g13681